jgi:hypothetical protein
MLNRASLGTIRIRAFQILIIALPLGSCSYKYDISAVVIGGKVAFVVDPNSASSANCIRSIRVVTDQNVRAAAVAGDDYQLVANGAFWWKDTAPSECLNPFPIVYGAQIRGTPLVANGKAESGVEAKELQIGVTYSVVTTGSGSGVGSGRFRIRSNRTVENLPKQ